MSTRRPTSSRIPGRSPARSPQGDTKSSFCPPLSPLDCVGGGWMSILNEAHLDKPLTRLLTLRRSEFRAQGGRSRPRPTPVFAAEPKTNHPGGFSRDAALVLWDAAELGIGSTTVRGVPLRKDFVDDFAGYRTRLHEILSTRTKPCSLPGCRRWSPSWWISMSPTVREGIRSRWSRKARWHARLRTSSRPRLLSALQRPGHPHLAMGRPSERDSQHDRECAS